jgi:hypothetical protein
MSPRRTRASRRLLALLGVVSSAVAAEQIDFNRQIRPILADACFHCHGPDAASREAKLRLDERDGLYRVREGVAVVVAGKPEESELLHRIVSSHEDEVMPPPRAARQLKPEEKDLLRRWVAAGAPWGRHWSFSPPVVAAPPQVPERRGWRSTPQVRNPVDAFVVARLQREGLAPSPEAPRSALLRRVSLDLTGLPPAPEELDAFLADSRPDAYERQVDRLLASPRYGERWAWDWLDAARYADTNGFQGDPERTMWPWRDWVVNALNANQPFDRFSIEQLAGDLLPEATREQQIASGFHRNNMFNGEGGRIAEETRVENVFDRVETTGAIWLGLTLSCARCHDHKYDPIKQKDFYRFFAYFNNGDEVNAKVPESTEAWAKYEGALAAHAEAGDESVQGEVPEGLRQRAQAGAARVHEDGDEHRFGAANAVAEHAEDQAARGPSEQEDGRRIARVFLDRASDLGRRRIGREGALEQFLHGRGAGEVEELLVHAVQQPACGGDDEDEPLVAVQEPPPGDRVGFLAHEESPVIMPPSLAEPRRETGSGRKNREKGRPKGTDPTGPARKPSRALAVATPPRHRVWRDGGPRDGSATCGPR